MVSLVIIAMHNGVLKLEWKYFTDLKQIIVSSIKQLKNSIILYIINKSNPFVSPLARFWDTMSVRELRWWKNIILSFKTFQISFWIPPESIANHEDIWNLSLFYVMNLSILFLDVFVEVMCV